MPFISQMIAEYATTGNGSVIHILATLFFYNLVTLILYICDVACVENLISWKMFQRKKVVAVGRTCIENSGRECTQLTFDLMLW